MTGEARALLDDAAAKSLPVGGWSRSSATSSTGSISPPRRRPSTRRSGRCR
ncbi:hypothetical protein [Halosegnis marinus]|uniref:hypothetical protein n=1 Tax=Halosegnis marinus TaxID=3034023 RepID=UPI003609E861